MYLSKVRLNALDRTHLAILSDCYESHKLISCACGSNKNGTRVLFRPETPDGPIAPLLVQSEHEPDWDRPRRELGVTVHAEYKEFEFPEIPSGTRLRFRLRANPVKTIRGGKDQEVDASGDPKRIRVPLKREEKQLAWLERKIDQAGAALEGALVQKEGDVVGRRKAKGPPLTFYSVRFDGSLVVTEPQALLAAMRYGIGPAKGFGFGLLSVSRAQ
jgi:CRISPR-associated protein Cas6/Cse3/CasE subtype I-E